MERALALNQNLAEAHIQMGRIKQQLDFDWAGADASFQRAVALDPGNPESVRVASFSAAMLGRFDEALPLNRRAVDLDRSMEVVGRALRRTSFYMGQLDQATADFKKALELNPDVVAAHEPVAGTLRTPLSVDRRIGIDPHVHCHLRPVARGFT